MCVSLRVRYNLGEGGRELCKLGDRDINKYKSLGVRKWL